MIALLSWRALTPPTLILISTSGSQMPSRTALSGALTRRLDVQKIATRDETDEWRRQRRLGMHHRCIKHIVDSINNFCEKDVHVQYADGQVKVGYTYLSRCTTVYFFRPMRPTSGVGSVVWECTMHATSILWMLSITFVRRMCMCSVQMVR